MDELNQTILLDNMMAEEFKTLAPYYNIPDVAKPNSITGRFSLLSTGTSILSNYLFDKEPSHEQDTVVSKLNFTNI